MKVLQVSKFYPPHLGGIETVARDLVHGLTGLGVQVDVLCANKAWRQVDEVDAQGGRVTRAASLGMLLSTSCAPGLPGLLRRSQADYDIVHVHMPDPLAALAVWYARPQARVVLHWHSDVVRQRFARHAYEPLQRWILRRADAVVCTSQDYATTSVPLRPWQHKVHVVPIGRPAPDPADPRLVGEIRRCYGGRRIVFSLGRMTHYKGYEVLVKAARALPPDVVVLVGGGGPALERYRQLAREAGVDERVHFIGPVSATRLEAHFAAADVFCMASTVRAEAYGVAVLEAMARGVPVVATRIPGSGLSWLHQHDITGLSVPPGDAQALAGAIGDILGDPAARARYAAGARARWAQGLTDRAMCERTLMLYRFLLDGALPRPAAL
ncbi:MAG: glycosyltransferase [Burkholderiaceae bacterium]|nr:glycosyltransferase [Burkholderiaceae bacterium]